MPLDPGLHEGPLDFTPLRENFSLSQLLRRYVFRPPHSHTHLQTLNPDPGCSYLRFNAFVFNLKISFFVLPPLLWIIATLFSFRFSYFCVFSLCLNWSVHTVDYNKCLCVISHCSISTAHAHNSWEEHGILIPITPYSKKKMTLFWKISKFSLFKVKRKYARICGFCDLNTTHTSLFPQICSPNCPIICQNYVYYGCCLFAFHASHNFFRN